jgi:putative hydrolase of the HAD superfamily
MFDKIVTDVFFDLDHTLWDFEKNSALTFEKILVENDVKVELADFLKVYVPNNLIFWKLFRDNKISKEDLRYQRLKLTFDTLKMHVHDAIIHRLAEEYINNLTNYNHLFPNTINVLNYLKPKYKLHIITNGFQEIQEKKLKNSGIYDYFSVFINADMAGVKKPNPLIFQLALEKANVQAEKAMMIGDSLEADILGAKAIGFHTLHFNAHAEENHDLSIMISDLNEIKSYL